ncbi:MAG: pyridoxamine 5'-phosphate oxidase family protein [Bacteroidetes bacterium]|nr:pyridoxamine 5'-phosphate oxidase family protein [Bacteroidota bacterium]
MFKEMRRKDRKLSEDESKKILSVGEYGVFSSVNSEGYAYGVPVNYVYADGVIYFHCAREGVKLDNITHNDRTSFCVVGKTKIIPEEFSTLYESVILFGRASIVMDDEERKSAFMHIVKKYSGEFLEKGNEYIIKDGPKAIIVKIVVEHLSGKAIKE